MKGLGKGFEEGRGEGFGEGFGERESEVGGATKMFGEWFWEGYGRRPRIVSWMAYATRGDLERGVLCLLLKRLA